MKKSLFNIVLLTALALIAFRVFAQSTNQLQLSVQTSTNVVTVTNIPPLRLSGADAVAVINQLYAITNASGATIVPPGMFTNRTRLMVQLQFIKSGTNQNVNVFCY